MMKDHRYVINVNHFHEAYKFLTPIRANKLTSIQICRESSSYRFKIFPEVPERSSVSYPYTIINPVDAFYEIIIKWCQLSRPHRAWRRALHFSSTLEADFPTNP